MATQLSQREKVLATIVGSVLALLLNVFVIRFFITHHRTLKDDLAKKQSTLAAMQVLVADRAVWDQRDAYLKKTQPPLKDEGVAGGELLQEVQDLARKHNVVQSDQAIDPVGPTRPGGITLPYTSVPVRLTCRVPWRSLVLFLHELQNPSKFLVVETADLSKDTQDATQMTGVLKIARWYAPKGR